MIFNIFLACVLTAAGGYLLGSILFGVLISKVMYNDDVRNHGSGNAGMTNVLRTYGKLPAVFTIIGDVGKSVAAVNLGRFIFDALLSGTGAAWQNPLDPVCGAYLAAIFCMIGHSRPLFFGFKGGKGVLVGAGSALATEPLVCAVLLGIFLIEVAVTRILLGEHEADTAHLAQVAAELIKVVAHVGSRAVAVIGQGLDHDGDAAGAVALVGDCFVLGLVAALGALDDALDVVVGHAVGLGLGDQGSQLGVGSRVAAALLNGNGDLTADLGENLGAGAVGLFLFTFDVIPFAMSGHGKIPLICIHTGNGVAADNYQ